MRINLNCPYEDRHEARKLGAWWDKNQCTWYVVDPEDLTPFMRWIHGAKPCEQKPAKKRKTKVTTGKQYRAQPATDLPPWEA